MCKKIMNKHWMNEIKEDEVRKFYQLICSSNYMELIDIFFKIEYLEQAITKCGD